VGSRTSGLRLDRERKDAKRIARLVAALEVGGQVTSLVAKLRELVAAD
jgi:hypothetical protein